MRVAWPLVLGRRRGVGRHGSEGADVPATNHHDKRLPLTFESAARNSGENFDMQTDREGAERMLAASRAQSEELRQRRQPGS
jgi:hypothetical protein